MGFWKVLKGKDQHDELRRIEAVIVLFAFLLLIAYVLNMKKWRSPSRFLHSILGIFDAVSDNMVTYAIGLMEQAPVQVIADHAVFSIWAILLHILSSSYNYDFDRSKIDRVKHRLVFVMNAFFAAVLNISTEFNTVTLLVWFLWFLHLSKFVLVSWVFELADASYRHGKNSRLVADYMRYEHGLTKPPEFDPVTMSGYKYLVHGEGKSKLALEDSDCLVKLKVENEDKLITLEKVWQCKGRLLDLNGDPDYKLKDLCLSFALYKLIRRRFDDLHPLPVADQPKAYALFREGLLREEPQSKGQEYQRVFRVIKIEMAFLNDYFHSPYPAILFKRYIVFSGLILVSFGLTCWLLVIVAGNKDHSFEEIVTIFLICMVISRAAVEVLSYVSSDWTKVLLLCAYVEHTRWHNSALVEMLLRFLLGLKILKHWHNKIHQYHLLNSFLHDPILQHSTESTMWKFKTWVKRAPRVKVPEGAKKVIFDSLREQINSGRLSNGMVSLQRNKVDEKLSWACNMRMNVHTILVWHVATCLCEINMSLRHGVARRSVRNCFWQTNFTLDRRSLKGARWQANYVVASSLSQYCMYLLVFCPKLLRYHSVAINIILQRTAVEARKILEVGRVRSMKDLYDRLWAAADGAEVEEGADNVMRLGAKCWKLGETLGAKCWKLGETLGAKCWKLGQGIGEGSSSNTKLGKTLMEDIRDIKDVAGGGEGADNVMTMGARLGKTLVGEINDEDKIWKVLADFWAEMVVYIAPCTNENAHEEHLNAGGEFLTHLWALLHHAGIDVVDDEAPVREVAEEKQQQQPMPGADSQSDMC